MTLGFLHPITRAWFESRFAAPTEPQRLGWPPITEGCDTLIAAPTGSGKTLTAFLAGLDRLLRLALAGELGEGTRILYVSPLRALSNDIRRNLEEPLAELLALARETSPGVPDITVQVRTGDTPASERQRMIRRPPHILVTTPESLYLVLTSERSREILRTVETVIVDEIHAMAGDKRGVHLSLSLERLTLLTGRRPQRVGLSATQSPIEEIARFLVGAEPASMPEIVNAGHVRELDLEVEAADFELGAVCMHEHWEKVYTRLVGLIESHRSTLVFVNTRRLAERVTHQLGERLGSSAVASHHGSLAQHIRRDAEQRLKNGQLKAVVATASLELGIDVGHIDLVCQISSPRSIAALLQRVGRAGHSLGALPKGRVFPLTRDDLLECAALVRAVYARRLDAITIPRAPLDILAQQIVATVASDEIGEEELWELCRRAYPYRELARDDFEAIVELLSEGYASSRGRRSSYLHRDRVNGRLRPRRQARLTAITCGGSIPEIGDYRVVTEDDKRTVVGSVDEDFAVESSAGDIFLLGNSSWMIQRLRGNDMMVVDVQGAPPTVPFWRGEGPGRSPELSEEVARLRNDLEERLCAPAGADPPLGDVACWLAADAHLNARGADQAVAYVAAQLAATGFLPSQRSVLFERFFDETGGMQIVVHAPFGIRVNRAWGLALRKRFCRSFDFELQASADDNGIVLSLGQQHSFPLDDLCAMVTPANGRALLEQAVLAVPFFTSRWRWNATRALALRRFERGRRVPPFLQRMRADDLLSAVFPAQTACLENVVGDIEVPDHPLVRQTMDDTLHEAMDVEGWLALLERVDRDEIEIVTMDTREPSPFSHERLNAQPYAFLDDAPLEERRARAIGLRRSLSVDAVRDLGQLDPEAIARVKADAWPLVRDRDELHDALLSVIALPEPAPDEWRPFFDELRDTGRATCWRRAASSHWIATERVPMARILWPDGRPEPDVRVPVSVDAAIGREDAFVALARGWLEISGPLTVTGLARSLDVPPPGLEVALLALESAGVVLRGRFTPDASDMEWCDRALLARIHRLTLDELRKRIKPVSVDAYVRFLLRHQHVHPDARLRGPRGTAVLLDKLEGFEAPAVDWEVHLFASRLESYDPAWIDQLALSGGAMWGRLRPAPSASSRERAASAPQAAPLDQAAHPEIVQPGRPMRTFTRTVPITIFRRDHYAWLAPADPAPDAALSARGQAVLSALRSGGALFRSQLAKRTRLLPQELDDALGELAAAGLVTSDGFDPLRALVGTSAAAILARVTRQKLGQALRRPRRQPATGRPGASRFRPTAAETGRWALLSEAADEAVDTTAHRVEEWCRVLLRRYGVVCRDALAKEAIAPSWGDLVRAYRALEARGEIRGGRFVADIAGEQYALPEATPALRSIAERSEPDPPVTLVATDPLNVFGRMIPGEKVPALSTNRIVIENGALVAGGKSDRVGMPTP